jgi:hypothetical protein
MRPGPLAPDRTLSRSPQRAGPANLKAKLVHSTTSRTQLAAMGVLASEVLAALERLTAEE